MTDKWEPGDLAVCVNTDDVWFIRPNGKPARGVAGRRFRRGMIYLVQKVGAHPRLGWGCPLLWFRGEEKGAGAFRFRKVPPHVQDQFGEEVIGLLTSKPKEPVA